MLEVSAAVPMLVAYQQARRGPLLQISITPKQSKIADLGCKALINTLELAQYTTAGAIVKDIRTGINIIRTIQALDAGKIDLSPKLLTGRATSILKFVSSGVLMVGLASGARRLTGIYSIENQGFLVRNVGRIASASEKAMDTHLSAVQGALENAEMAYEVLAADEARTALPVTATKWEKMKTSLRGVQSFAAIGFTILSVVAGPQVKAGLALVSVAMGVAQLYLDSRITTEAPQTV